MVCIFCAIVNYSIVGISILYINQQQSNGDGDNLDSSERAALMAKGSYACLYLINAFTIILSSSEIVTEVLGK